MRGGKRETGERERTKTSKRCLLCCWYFLKKVECGLFLLPYAVCVYCVYYVVEMCLTCAVDPFCALSLSACPSACVALCATACVYGYASSTRQSVLSAADFLSSNFRVTPLSAHSQTPHYYCVCCTIPCMRKVQ